MRFCRDGGGQGIWWWVVSCPQVCGTGTHYSPTPCHAPVGVVETVRTLVGSADCHHDVWTVCLPIDILVPSEPEAGLPVQAIIGHEHRGGNPPIH